MTIIDHNCADAAALQPNRHFLESPHAFFIPVGLPSYKQYDPTAPLGIKGYQDDWWAMLFCQFAWLFVVGGYKSKGVCN